MTQKEMKKLSRKRMLEMLAEQTGRTNRLRRENARLKERIADREQHLAQLGELAETILNTDTSPDEEPATAEEGIAEVLPEASEFQGDETIRSVDDASPDAAVMDINEISSEIQPAADVEDTDRESDGSAQVIVSESTEAEAAVQKTKTSPAGMISSAANNFASSVDSWAKNQERKAEAKRSSDTKSPQTGGIGGNILSATSSVLMLGAAAAMLFKKKRGKHE